MRNYVKKDYAGFFISYPFLESRRKEIDDVTLSSLFDFFVHNKNLSISPTTNLMLPGKVNTHEDGIYKYVYVPTRRERICIFILANALRNSPIGGVASTLFFDCVLNKVRIIEPEYYDLAISYVNSSYCKSHLYSVRLTVLPGGKYDQRKNFSKSYKNKN